MHKYKTLLIFLLLVAIWSLFFSSIKFFLWLDLKGGLDLSLQTISGYMSLGGAIAYLTGGALAYTFLKKYLLFSISLFALLFASFGYFIGFQDGFFVGIIITAVGIFYGLWSVLRNVIVAIEIEKTGLPDTTINAISSVTFVIFIIFGSILGSKIFENLGHTGFIGVIIMLFFSSIISLFLDYDKEGITSLLKHGFKKYYFDRKHKFTQSMKDYLPDVVYIIKKYHTIIIVSSLLWGISTIVSQQAIEYSVNTFDKKSSEASILLLFSAVGVIIGSLVSMKMEKKRWLYFSMFNVGFAFITITFPFIASSFEVVEALAFIVGFFFGGAVNLIDAFYLRKIGEEDKKEYGSSTLGLVLSIVIFITMFFSNAIFQYFGEGKDGFTGVMVILGSIVLLTTVFVYKLKREE